MKNILVTGGAGYCGSVLIPKLLEAGYQTTVYDILYFGSDFLPLKHPNLRVIKGDIREIGEFEAAVRGQDIVLHLACISNDASFVLDEKLSTSINMDAFEPLVVASKNAGVKRFVYASSSSVYGVSSEREVTEDHPLVPLTLYNKYKGLCEPLLLKHTSESFIGVIFRPATVCGYAPRQRLDLSVNILTNHAVNKENITVFGGDQLRPNLHIQDYVDLCLLLISAEDKNVANEVFNCGYQNMSIMQIAQTVKKVVEAEMPDIANIKITTTPSDDNRSYHINSDKIFNKLGFKATRSVEAAIKDLCDAFKQGKIPNSFDEDWYHNVRTMTAISAK